MHVIFNHGKESGPHGRKIEALMAVARESGHSVQSLDYTDLPDAPEARVARLIETLDTLDEAPWLVGSSMGAYVALAAARERATRGLFLLAPAVYLEGYAVQHFTQGPPTTIVHGWADELIPWSHALRLARAVEGELHLVHADHRLTAVHALLQALFRLALSKIPPA